MGRGRGQRGRSSSPGRLVGTIPGSPESIRHSPPLTSQRGTSPTEPEDAVARLKLESSPIPIVSAHEAGANRGARRGSRSDRGGDNIVTRPNDLATKQGNKGTAIRLLSNYFPMMTGPMWKLYRYHVYFEPLVDDKNTRYKLLKLNADKLGSYMYNGTNLFTGKQLDPSFTFLAKLAGAEDTKIRCIETSALEPGDPTYITFYNSILKRLLYGMGLEQMGRNFFNRHKAIEISKHKLTLWPGTFYIVSSFPVTLSRQLSTPISNNIVFFVSS